VGFEEVKRQVIEALRTGNYLNEHRSSREKNLLAAGLLDVTTAIELVQRTRGQQAQSSPHHFNPSVRVWIFRPSGWYIKFYLSGTCWFLSFHREGES